MQKNRNCQENTTIYYVNGNPGSGATEITLTSVEGNIVPKETPVLLKTSNTTDYTITLTPTADDSEDDFSTNALTYKSKSFIALKEARESLYWIELLHRNKYLDDKEYASIFSDAEELVKILVARCKKLDAEV